MSREFKIGDRVLLSNGRSGRVVCTDVKGDLPLGVLVDCTLFSESETLWRFKGDGFRPSSDIFLLHAPAKRYRNVRRHEEGYNSWYETLDTILELREHRIDYIGHLECELDENNIYVNFKFVPLHQEKFD